MGKVEFRAGNCLIPHTVFTWSDTRASVSVVPWKAAENSDENLTEENYKSPAQSPSMIFFLPARVASWRACVRASSLFKLHTSFCRKTLSKEMERVSRREQHVLEQLTTQWRQRSISPLMSRSKRMHTFYSCQRERERAKKKTSSVINSDRGMWYVFICFIYL